MRPTTKSLIKERKEAAHQVVVRKPTKLEKSFATVASTEEGLQVLTEIARICGWQVASLPTDSSGKIDQDKNLVQTSKRVVWANLRRFVPIDRLILIEHPVYEEEK